MTWWQRNAPGMVMAFVTVVVLGVVADLIERQWGGSWSDYLLRLVVAMLVMELYDEKAAR